MSLLPSAIHRVFVTQWSNLVMIANYQTKNLADAEDVVQDLYVELDTKYHEDESFSKKLKNEVEIGKFLRTCAKFRAIDYVRKLKTQTYGSVVKAFQVGHMKGGLPYPIVESIYKETERQWRDVYLNLNLTDWEWWIMEQVGEGMKVEKIYYEGIKLSTLTELNLYGLVEKDIGVLRKKISSIRSKAAFKFPFIAAKRKPTRNKMKKIAAIC